MLALAELRAGTCTGCGGQLAETTRPDMEGQYDVGPPHRCHQCTALAVKQDAYKHVGQTHALMWVAERK